MSSARLTSAGLDEWYEAVGYWSLAWTSLLPDWLRAAPVAQSAVAPDIGEPRRPRTHPRGRAIRELSVGESASATSRITQDDIDAFARISGDDGSLHDDDDRAALSGVLGTLLGGPLPVHMSQTLRWVAPVRPGDVLTTTATVTAIIAERERVVLETVVTRDGEPVLIGEALVKVPAARERRRTPVRTRAVRPGSTPREARRPRSG